MTKIIVGFSRPKKHIFPILSWLIRLVENTKFSHTYIRWYDADLGTWLIFEAFGKTVQVTNFTNRKPSLDIVEEIEIPVSPETKRAIITKCWQIAGIPYGSNQLIGMALVKLAKLFNKKIDNPFPSQETAQVCSESVGYVLRDVLNFKIEKDMDIFGIRDIYELVKNNTNKSI